MPSGAKAEAAPTICLAGLLRTCGLDAEGEPKPGGGAGRAGSASDRASPQRRPAAGMLRESVRRRLRRAGWMHGEGR